MKSQKTLCLKCGKRGEALVCSNQSCPIVVHESCMPCAAHFDDTGCFYCPYCLLKLSLVECHQAREKALLARRALVSFLGTRTRNDAGYLNNSHSLKRKKPEAPTIVKEMNDASCDRVHQPVQLEHQDDSRSLETLSGNKQQAGPTKVHCLGKVSVTKDDGNLANSCRFIVKKVEGYKTGKQEEVQTLPCFRIENNRSGDCGIAYEIKLKNDVLFTREDTELVSQTKKSTNDNEKTAKKVEISFGGVEREQTQTDVRETPCLANSLEINEKSYKGNAFQDNCFVRTQVEDIFIRPAENGEDCTGRTDEGSRKAKAAVHPKGNDSESLPCGESANLSVKYPDIEQTVANCYDSVAEKVQTHEGPQETSVFYVRNVNASVMRDNPDEIIDGAYQEDYSVISQVTVNSGNIKHCSRVVENLSDDGRTIFKSPIQDAYTTREDNESVKHEKSGNSINENDEISKPMDQCYNGQAEEKQTREESQEGYVCLAKENTMAIYEQLDEVKDSESREECFPRSERVENSGNIKHCSRVVENLSDDGRTIFKSPIQDAYTTREDNESVKHEKSGNSINENEEISKPMDQCYNGQAEEEQTREESQEGYACLVKENTTAIYEQLDEVKDSESREECFPRSERVENSGNADRPAEIGSNCYRSADGITTQGNALQDPVHLTRKDNAEVTRELGNLTRKQPETTTTLKGYHNRVAETVQTWAELRSTRDVDKQEMVEEFDAEDCRSFQDECFLKRERRGRKDADKNACIGEDRFGRTSEGQTRVEIVKNPPQNTKNGTVSVSLEEFGSVDDTESCNTEYLPHRIHAGKKRQMKKNLKNDVKHGESSGCSENEIEEHELSMHDKSEHKVKSIKQIQRSTTLSSARRRKLPWTVQEVEMLKEGVQIYSLKANKNLPWMKILEFGHHVFDGTRTPADLKDKWRNMKGKGNAK